MKQALKISYLVLATIWNGLKTGIQRSVVIRLLFLAVVIYTISIALMTLGAPLLLILAVAGIIGWAVGL